MPVQCDICSRYFKTPETLASHQAFHVRQAKQEDAKSKEKKRTFDQGNKSEPAPIPLKHTKSIHLGVDMPEIRAPDPTPEPPIEQPQGKGCNDPQAAASSADQTVSVIGTRKTVPFALSANRMRVFLSPITLWLCSFCMEQSSKKEAWEFKESGRTYLTISMCKECIGGNTDMQKVITDRWVNVFQKKLQERCNKASEENQASE